MITQVMSSLDVFNALILFVLIISLTGAKRIDRDYDDRGGGGLQYQSDGVATRSKRVWIADQSEEDRANHQANAVLSSPGYDSVKLYSGTEGEFGYGGHGYSDERPRQMDRLKCGQSMPSMSTRSINSELIVDNKEGFNTTYFMAMVRAQLNEHRYIFCSGALISDRHVLTAAHCVSECLSGDRHHALNSQAVTVSLGAKSARWSGPLPTRASSVIIHPEFQHCHKDFKNDLAIIRLASRVQYSPKINRICLPPQHFMPKGSPVAFYGYGFTNITKELYVPWRRLNTYLANNTDNLSECDPEMLCTSSNQQARTCPGDSGGPLVAQAPGGWILLGINSVTNGDYTRYADCDKYVDKVFNRPRFVNVRMELDWIGRMIEKN